MLGSPRRGASADRLAEVYRGTTTPGLGFIHLAPAACGLLGATAAAVTGSQLGLTQRLRSALRRLVRRVWAAGSTD